MASSSSLRPSYTRGPSHVRVNIRSRKTLIINETVEMPQSTTLASLRLFLRKTFPYLPFLFKFETESKVRINQDYEDQVLVSTMSSVIYLIPSIPKYPKGQDPETLMKKQIAALSGQTGKNSGSPTRGKSRGGSRGGNRLEPLDPATSGGHSPVTPGSPMPMSPAPGSPNGRSPSRGDAGGGSYYDDNEAATREEDVSLPVRVRQQIKNAWELDKIKTINIKSPTPVIDYQSMSEIPAEFVAELRKLNLTDLSLDMSNYRQLDKLQLRNPIVSFNDTNEFQRFALRSAVLAGLDDKIIKIQCAARQKNSKKRVDGIIRDAHRDALIYQEKLDEELKRRQNDENEALLKKEERKEHTSTAPVSEDLVFIPFNVGDIVDVCIDDDWLPGKVVYVDNATGMINVSHYFDGATTQYNVGHVRPNSTYVPPVEIESDSLGHVDDNVTIHFKKPRKKMHSKANDQLRFLNTPTAFVGVYARSPTLDSEREFSSGNKTTVRSVQKLLSPDPDEYEAVSTPVPVKITTNSVQSEQKEPESNPIPEIATLEVALAPEPTPEPVAEVQQEQEQEIPSAKSSAKAVQFDPPASSPEPEPEVVVVNHSTIASDVISSSIKSGIERVSRPTTPATPQSSTKSHHGLMAEDLISSSIKNGIQNVSRPSTPAQAAHDVISFSIKSGMQRVSRPTTPAIE